MSLKVDVKRRCVQADHLKARLPRPRGNTMGARTERNVKGEISPTI